MRNDYKIRPRLGFKKGGFTPIDPLEEALKNSNEDVQGAMKRTGKKKGGKAFPDLTGDGKVTFKDVLKGRGVIKKKGGMIKKGKK